MVIECAYGRLKAQFPALRRTMDINLQELPSAINDCFVLHNFCELLKNVLSNDRVFAAIKYDKDSNHQERFTGNCQILMRQKKKVKVSPMYDSVHWGSAR